jgi:hypothetical protein
VEHALSSVLQEVQVQGGIAFLNRSGEIVTDDDRAAARLLALFGRERGDVGEIDAALFEDVIDVPTSWPKAAKAARAIAKIPLIGA